METVTELAVAEQIARQAHAGQTDKYDTSIEYIRHVERIVAAVEGHEAKAVAWLHDVVEDTPITISELLKAGISTRVTAAVALLTRGTETYVQYIEWVRMSKDSLVLAVKVADLRDHLREETLHLLPDSAIKRYEKALERLVT